jgi:predicted transglutaminase-like cysteine proteinase
MNLISLGKAAIAALFLMLLVPASARAEDLWGSNEIRSNDTSNFSNWTGVVRRFANAEALGQGLCSTAAGGGRGNTTCAWDKWQEILDEARGLAGVEQARAVNAAFNRVKYVNDNRNYGQEDYWATLFEFLGRERGDCEDYAIAKYETLRELGWPAKSLRLVVVRDTKLDLNHAILAVYTNEGIYIADNQTKSLVNASSIRHYRPIYSINEDGWWLHRRRG